MADAGTAQAPAEESTEEFNSVLQYFDKEDDYKADSEERGDGGEGEGEVLAPEVEAASEAEVEAAPEVVEEATVATETQEESPKSHMIPKARLDQQLAKTRELEHENVRIQEQMRIMQDQFVANQQQQVQSEDPQPQEPQFDFGGKYKEMQEAYIDGESDKASNIFSDIMGNQQQVIQDGFQKQINNTLEANNHKMGMEQQLSDAAREIAQVYPELDIDKPDTFNKELTDQVNELMVAYSELRNDKGIYTYSPAEALKKAAAVFAPNLPSPSSDKGSSSLESGDKNLSKKIKAANNQPPALLGDSATSHGERKINPLTMTEAEWEALPPSTLARLRGDV
jgi:hypothetical protein